MVRINLLPAKVSKKKQLGTRQIAIGAAVLLAALVANFAWSAARNGALVERQARAQRTRSEIAQLEKIIGEVNDIKKQQAAVRDKLAILDKLKAGRAGPVRLLDELATVLPKRLWLKKLEEKEKAVVFDGAASSIDDVSLFMSGLERSPFFTSVELKSTTAKADGRYRVVDFTVTAAVDYAAAAPLATAEAPKVR